MIAGCHLRPRACQLVAGAAAVVAVAIVLTAASFSCPDGDRYQQQHKRNHNQRKGIHVTSP